MDGGKSTRIGERRFERNDEPMTYKSFVTSSLAGLFELTSVAVALVAWTTCVAALFHVHVPAIKGVMAALGLHPRDGLGLAVFGMLYSSPVFIVLAGLVLARFLQQRAKLTRAREDHRAPFLLLRSFREPGPAGMPGQESRGSTAWGTPLGGKAPISLVDPVARALSPIGVSILVGATDNLSLTARSRWEVSTNDDSWLDVVAGLAGRCRAVLLFPASTAGVVRELELLSDLGLLDATIVVMPPQRLAPNMDPERLWNSLAMRLQARGYHLPAYRSSGTFFIPKSDLSVSMSAEILPRGMGTAFQEILAHIGPRGRPLREILPLLLEPRAPRAR